MPRRISDEEVFDATLASVVEHGYQGATTRRIAEAAGINEVTLFRRYGDKAGLLRAAIHHDISEFATEGVTPTGDLVADLQTIVTYYSELYEHRGGLVLTLMLESIRDGDIAAQIREPSLVIGRIQDLVKHYQDAGELVEEPASAAVEALLGPLLLHAITSRIAGHPRSRRTDPEAVVRRFLDGRSART